MSRKNESTVLEREEFVRLAAQEGTHVRELCRRFALSSKTAYKWIRRFREEGRAGLEDRSRRPRRSPRRTPARVEARIVKLRAEHPAWGARKLKRRLEDRDARPVPSASVVHAVLQRHGLVAPTDAEHPGPWQRFERPEPNDLWQMDFMGHFAVEDGARCHPWTVLDDHSRFCIALRALSGERLELVVPELEAALRRHGLPRAILCDNGPPWGDPQGLTQLELWLLDRGVEVLHGRPRHPQTQGKDERFHRTVKAEAVAGRSFESVGRCQPPFDRFRQRYNFERPHQALGLDTPGSRYRCSPRPLPRTVPEPQYGPDDAVRTVQDGGWLYFHGYRFRLSHVLKGRPVALRPTADDGLFEVYYRQRCVNRIDLGCPKP